MELNYDKAINGEQFLDELIAANVKITKNDIPRIENNIIFINVDKKDELKTSEIWTNHIAEGWTNKKNEARQAVLAKLGLTADEIAALSK